MKYRALLFDWSGTLVDDLPPTLYATNAVLAEYGVPPMDREEFRQRFRLPYPEFYAEVLPGVPVSEVEDTFRSAFHQSPEKVSVLPHAREMLNFCRDEGIICYVLSSMDIGILDGQLDDFGLRSFFSGVYSGIVDKREKIGEVLTINSLSKSSTAFIGDMVHDIMTAKHGGITSVAVTTGYDPVERLQRSEPDYLFENLAAFQQSLK